MVLSLACTAAWAAASTAPEDFVGIKWGASREEIKSAMKEKHTNTMPRASTDSHLAFSGGTASGFSVQWWGFDTGEDKFWQGKITFAENGDVELFFKQVKKMLTEKYGTRQSESFKPGEPAADWKLPNPETKDEISIHLSTSGRNKQKRLCLEYVNETLKAKYPAPPGATGTVTPKPTDNGF